MTETISTNITQPVRPRTGQKYELLRETAIVTAAVPLKREIIFTMHITVSNEKGAPMNIAQNFLIDLIFKPNEPGLKLRPEETQLLLAHIGEILKEVEEEEPLIEQEKAVNGKEEFL